MKGAGRGGHAAHDIAICLADAAFTLLFAVTALPGFTLAFFGRLPRVALARVFFLLCVMPYLLGRANLMPAHL